MDEQKNNELQDDELERYGVWVKAGPEEVVEADDDYSFADLSGADVDATPSGEPAAVAPNDAAEPDDMDLDLDDLDFDDDLVTIDDLDVSVPDEEPDPFAALPDEPSGSTNEPADAESDEGDGFALDDITEDLPDDFEELDLDAADPLSGAGAEDGFDASIPGLDDELGELSEDDISIGSDSEDLPELEVPELEPDVADEHDFTPEGTGIEIVQEAPTNSITEDEAEFLDDEDDLPNLEERGISAGMDPQEQEAFELIQTELGDIKRELAELKAALRAGVNPLAQSVPVEEDATSSETVLDGPDEPDESGDQEAAGPGFFDEDEDETIALTGDELDNILNTAEFTEEAGEEAELEDEFLDGEPAPAEPENDLPVTSIELEPVDSAADMFEGDESAVDELAEMDIDRELADIDELSDDTEEQGSDIDDLDLDIDDLDIDDSVADDVLDAHAEDETLAAAAAADLDALSAEPDLSDVEGLDAPEQQREVDDLEIDDLEIDAEDSVSSVPEAESDEFEDFASAVEDDIATAGVETDDDFDLEVDDTAAAGEGTLPIDAEEEEPGEEIDLDIDDLDLEDELDDPLTEEDFSAIESSEETPDVADIDAVGELDSSDFGVESQASAEVDVNIDAPASVGPSETQVEPEPEPASGPVTESTGEAAPGPVSGDSSISDLPDDLKQEIRSVLSYMDQLLEALPDDKIEEFAHSEHFEVYKRLFEELGLET